MNDPYLFFSIEEISEVKCVENWRNRNVRILGRITTFQPLTGHANLTSEGEDIVSSIKVSFLSFFEGQSSRQIDLIKVGSLVQVLGQVDVLNDEPVINAHIVKDMLGLDTASYARAVDRIQPYLPINIDFERE